MKIKKAYFKKANPYFKDEDLIDESHVERAKLRTMNRGTRILLKVCEELKLLDFFKQFDASELGVYSAHYTSVFPKTIYNHPNVKNDYGRVILDQLNPLSLFHRSNAITTSHVSSFLNIRGPSFTFSHCQWGLYQAFDQAKFDLERGAITCALITFVNVLQDDSSREAMCCVDQNIESIFLACINEVEPIFFKSLFEQTKEKNCYDILKEYTEK